MLRKLRQKNGFSLLELAIALFVISVILLAASNLVSNLLGAEKHRRTVREMKKIAYALVGNSHELQPGHRATFGYFEMHNAFPGGAFPDTDAVGYLQELIQEPYGTNLHDLIRDDWGNFYQFGYVVADQEYVLRSLGRDGATGGTGLDADIDFEFDNDVFNDNRIRIMVKDAAGTLLRGCYNSGGTEPAYYHHIGIVQMAGYGDVQPTFDWAAGTAGGELEYANGYFYNDATDPIKAGFYQIAVSPIEGGGVSSLSDGVYRLDDDLTAGEDAIRKMVVVNPRGDSVVQHFEVRFPGVLDYSDEVGTLLPSS